MSLLLSHVYYRYHLSISLLSAPSPTYAVPASVFLLRTDIFQKWDLLGAILGLRYEMHGHVLVRISEITLIFGFAFTVYAHIHHCHWRRYCLQSFLLSHYATVLGWHDGVVRAEVLIYANVEVILGDVMIHWYEFSSFDLLPVLHGSVGDGCTWKPTDALLCWIEIIDESW